MGSQTLFQSVYIQRIRLIRGMWYRRLLRGDWSDNVMGRVRLRERPRYGLSLCIHRMYELVRLHSVLRNRLSINLPRLVQDFVVLLRVREREAGCELLLVVRASERHASCLHFEKLDLLLLLFLLFCELRKLADIFLVDDDVASVVGSLTALSWLCAVLSLVHDHLRPRRFRMQLLLEESSAFLLVFGEELC